MGASGKRERILITCSTFEVAKIVEPAKFYDVTKVHLVHYDHKDVYVAFFTEVVHRLKEWKPSIEIIEHNDEPVYDFTKMMDLVMTAISKENRAEDKPEIFVNISSGTHEFTAAAVIASMMWDNTMAFTVPTKEFKVKDNQIISTYYAEDKVTPVGLTESTKDPLKLSAYRISQPDRKLVIGLGKLSEMLEAKSDTAAPAMIGVFVKLGLMTAEYVRDDKPDQKTIMSYQRNFIDKWTDLGWVERVSKRKLRVTEEGKQIISTFLGCCLAKKED